MRRRLLHDWEARLFSYLNGLRDAEMRWGEFDCATGLVAGAVQAQTGVDLGAPFRQSYSNEAEALRFLRDNNWRGLTLDDKLGAMMDHFLVRSHKGRLTRRGNIVLLNSVIGAGFGVRTSPFFAVALREQGGTIMLRIPDRSPEWVVTS